VNACISSVTTHVHGAACKSSNVSVLLSRLADRFLDIVSTKLLQLIRRRGDVMSIPLQPTLLIRSVSAIPYLRDIYPLSGPGGDGANDCGGLAESLLSTFRPENLFGPLASSS
jgi:hypothetical protein